jgi:hypothetical protein
MDRRHTAYFTYIPGLKGCILENRDFVNQQREAAGLGWHALKRAW